MPLAKIGNCFEETTHCSSGSQILNRLSFGKPIDLITNFWYDTLRRSIHLHTFNQESVEHEFKGKKVIATFCAVRIYRQALNRLRNA